MLSFWHTIVLPHTCLHGDYFLLIHWCSSCFLHVWCTRMAFVSFIKYKLSSQFLIAILTLVFASNSRKLFPTAFVWGFSFLSVLWLKWRLWVMSSRADAVALWVASNFRALCSQHPTFSSALEPSTQGKQFWTWISSSGSQSSFQLFADTNGALGCSHFAARPRTREVNTPLRSFSLCYFAHFSPLSSCISLRVSLDSTLYSKVLLHLSYIC